MADSVDCWRCIYYPLPYIEMNTASRYEITFGVVLLSIEGKVVVASRRVKSIIDFSEKIVDSNLKNPY